MPNDLFYCVLRLSPENDTRGVSLLRSLNDSDGYLYTLLDAKETAEKMNKSAVGSTVYAVRRYQINDYLVRVAVTDDIEPHRGDHIEVIDSPFLARFIALFWIIRFYETKYGYKKRDDLVRYATYMTRKHEWSDQTIASAEHAIIRHMTDAVNRYLDIFDMRIAAYKSSKKII